MTTPRTTPTTSVFAFDFYYDGGTKVYRVWAATVREAEELAIDRHGDDWEKRVKIEVKS